MVRVENRVHGLTRGVNPLIFEAGEDALREEKVAKERGEEHVL